MGVAAVPGTAESHLPCPQELCKSEVLKLLLFIRPRCPGGFPFPLPDRALQLGYLLGVGVMAQTPSTQGDVTHN